MLLMLTPEEMAWFRRLFLQGPTKVEAEAGHGLQALLDRSWATRDDDGCAFLTRDGIEIGQMAGLAHGGGGAAEEAGSSRA